MAGKVTVEYTEADLIQLIREDMNSKMPGVILDKNGISIEVKSKQNYRAEWESAAFRGIVKTQGALL